MELQTLKKQTIGVDKKIILLGDDAVGKTSVIRRYIYNEFKTYMPTIGADFIRKVWNNSNFVIWDTPGNERFNSLNKIYCRGANAVILCYSMEKKDTFEALDEQMKLLDLVAENCIIIIVGTKLDLVCKNRAVSSSDAREKMLKYNKQVNTLSNLSAYFETSAKNNESVTEMFEYVFQLLIFGKSTRDQSLLK